MEAKEYQRLASSFATGGGKTIAYALLGLIEEVGELVEKITPIRPDDESEEIFRDAILVGKKASKRAKHIRKCYNELTTEEWEALDMFFIREGEKGASKEVGDCLWMLAQLCTNLEWNLGDIMNDNICKLTDRQQRGVIVGEGDNR